ncbi:phospholipase D-like domain-containing protein [Thermus sediminis]|uniref:hypothetical protein n=1 Tax=Thermus sediminis TaxID=1761908 RepID=UPI001E3EBC3B|nr:hypothetical protein [Thermus sediminis]
MHDPLFMGNLFGLQVFRAELLGPASFSLEELEGARRLRVLTHSASARLLARLSREVEELEVVFGYETALPLEGAFQRLLEVQFLVQEEVARSLRVVWEGEEERLAEKARLGKLRFLLSRRPSHAKLFLVEEADGTRWALLGSPNLSERALETGEFSQLEFALRFEGEEAFRTLEALYEAVRGESDPLRPELLLREAKPHELPLLEGAAGREVVLAVREVEVPAVMRVECLPAPKRRAAQAIAQAAEAKRKGEAKVFTLGRKGLEVARRLPLSQEEEAPLLDLTEEGVLLQGELRPFLSLEAPGVREDAEAILAFLSGYERHFLERDDALRQTEAFFRLLAWLYASPYMASLLHRAHLEGLPPHAYPLWAVVYGKSNTGKTSFLRFALKSMAGLEVGMQPGKDFTKERVEALRALSRFPVVYDDVSLLQVRNPGESLIKGDYEFLGPPKAPVVLSLNASQSYRLPDEVRKRALLVYTDAVLPQDRAKRVHAEAQRLLLTVGDRFFRALAPRVREALGEREDWLEAATSVLAEAFRELLGRVPPWVRTYTAEEESARYLEEVRELVRKVLSKHPYRLEGGEVWVKTPGEETAKAYAKELPGWCAEESRGEYLVLRAEPLRRMGLLGLSLWPFRKRG